MKKFLVFMFLTTNIFAYEILPNNRSESLGGTGMIFGEEYGSFYLAPTSMQKENINILGTFSFLRGVFGNGYLSLRYSLFFKTRIGSFSVGYDTTLFKNNRIPLTYSFEIYNLSVGIGLIYNKDEYFFSKKKYLLANFSDMYKSAIGDFALALNSFYLRLGYGKEFKVNYIFDKIQFAFEINNLLMKMNNNYINDESKNYSFYDKIHLGIEFSRCILEVTKANAPIDLSIRLGMKNFFPTFGLGLEFFEAFRLEYSFSNKDEGDRWGQNRKLVNYFSFELRPNNIYWQKAMKAMKAKKVIK